MKPENRSMMRCCNTYRYQAGTYQPMSSGGKTSRAETASSGRYASSKSLSVQFFPNSAISPYTLKTVTPALVAKPPMQKWAQILQRSAFLKRQFETEVMRTIDEVTLHYSQLHFYNAQKRLDRLKRRNPPFLCRIHKRLLSAYLNMAP